MYACVCAGVAWADMHRLAERVLLEELKALGLLQGDVSAVRLTRTTSAMIIHFSLAYIC